jgi:hypothetical protein
LLEDRQEVVPFLGSVDLLVLGVHCVCSQLGDIDRMRPMLLTLLALPKLLAPSKLRALCSGSRVRQGIVMVNFDIYMKIVEDGGGLCLERSI